MESNKGDVLVIKLLVRLKRLMILQKFKIPKFYIKF